LLLLGNKRHVTHSRHTALAFSTIGPSKKSAAHNAEKPPLQAAYTVSQLPCNTIATYAVVHTVPEIEVLSATMRRSCLVVLDSLHACLRALHQGSGQAHGQGRMSAEDG